MRRQLLIAALLAVTPLLGATTHAPPLDHGESQTILRIEDQWLHAKTVQEAARFLAPEFIGVSTRGVVESREERLARFRTAPQPPATSVHFEHLTVSFPAPTVAIATGEVIGIGSDRRAVYVVAFSDTFCLRHRRWLAVHAQETLASPPAP